MLNSSDYEAMRKDLEAVRGDHEVEIVIRRGETTLAAQPVRISRFRKGFRMQTAAGEESRGDIVVMGGVDFDVQAQDRFTVDGMLYRIIFVRPNRMAAVTAEAEAVE
jgi:hypothetical protein